jgi:hypothetical protein
VSQLEEFAAGNLHGEVCEGGDSGASQYRISSTRSLEMLAEAVKGRPFKFSFEIKYLDEK